MYNDSYYSRRGRTIQRKKIDNGHVINPSLVPVYYNYLRDNGMFPSAPPPPVHVDDGKCIAVDYDNQSYSFPSVETPLTNALGTLLFNLGIEVDINNVDHIVLSFYGSSNSSSVERNLWFSTSGSNSVAVGDYLGSGRTSNPYTLTFVRDYGSSDTVFYLACTKSWQNNNLDDLVTPSNKLSHVRQGLGNVKISRIVVATLSETI